MPPLLHDPGRLVRPVKPFTSYGQLSVSRLSSAQIHIPEFGSAIMGPEPLYQPAELRPAYQLRYGWTAWPSRTPFPADLLERVLPEISPEWESDGLRVLESSVAAERLQLTLSTTPQVAPVTLAARVKGRIQHHCRRRGRSIAFSRKLAVRSLGDPDSSPGRILHP